jgi:hypothetical protein
MDHVLHVLHGLDGDGITMIARRAIYPSFFPALLSSLLALADLCRSFALLGCCGGRVEARAKVAVSG